MEKETIHKNFQILKINLNNWNTQITFLYIKDPSVLLSIRYIWKNLHNNTYYQQVHYVYIYAVILNNTRCSYIFQRLQYSYMIRQKKKCKIFHHTENIKQQTLLVIWEVVGIWLEKMVFKSENWRDFFLPCIIVLKTVYYF